MDTVEQSTLQVVGGFPLLAMLFVVREVAAGALKEAGRELGKWVQLRRRSAG